MSEEMYGQAEFERLYVERAYANERNIDPMTGRVPPNVTGVPHPAEELLNLLCEAVFVELPGWQSPPPLVKVTVDGAEYDALEVELGLSPSSIPKIIGRYDKVEFFALGRPGPEGVRIAYRKTDGPSVSMHYAELSVLPTVTLQAIEGRIMIRCHKSYEVAHDKLRRKVETAEGKRREELSAP